MQIIIGPLEEFLLGAVVLAYSLLKDSEVEIMGLQASDGPLQHGPVPIALERMLDVFVTVIALANEPSSRTRVNLKLKSPHCIADDLAAIIDDYRRNRIVDEPRLVPRLSDPRLILHRR